MWLKYAPILLAVTLLALATPASAADCRSDTQPGTDCTCKLADLHPTQRAIGRLHVDELKAQGFDKLAEHVAKPDSHAVVVIGPGNLLYLVDGHHHARAMIELRPAGSTTCLVKSDLRNLPSDPSQFWPAMAKLGLARLEGPDGRPANGAVPPPNLLALADDPFRSVASWLEDKCDVKLTGDFAEFRLADLLRTEGRVRAPRREGDRKDALKDALDFVHKDRAQVLLAALPGAAGLKTCH